MMVHTLVNSGVGTEEFKVGGGANFDGHHGEGAGEGYCQLGVCCKLPHSPQKPTLFDITKLH